MLIDGDWLVVGSGPSARDLDPKMFANPTVVAVNTAAARIGVEHWDYWVRIADRRRHELQKLQVLCPGGVEVQIHSKFAAEFEMEPFVPGSYTPWCDPVGATAVQWACNHGAQVVRVKGFEGIRGKTTVVLGAADPFGHYKIQRNRLQTCINAYPEVSFIFFGEMSYKLTGQNVKYEQAFVEDPA